MPEAQELGSDELEEMATLAEQAATILGVSLDHEPKFIVTTINTLLRQIEHAERERPDDDVIIGCGILLAYQYARAFDWKWAYITWEGGYQAHAITSPDRATAITPIQWVNEISKGERTTNVLLNFNMVEAGRLPNEDPGACALFM